MLEKSLRKIYRYESITESITSNLSLPVLDLILPKCMIGLFFPDDGMSEQKPYIQLGDHDPLYRSFAIVQILYYI